MQLFLLILALVLFLVSAALYLAPQPEGRPGIAGAALALGLAAFTGATLVGEI